jgi:hypothetical protein
MIELTREDRKAIWDLSEQWKDAANQLKNWEFDYDGFKVMAKQTYSWLEKFFLANVFPDRIVTLLLGMKEFSCDLYSVSPEASAAQLLTETLGDPENLFGILGDNYEVAPDGERELWVEIYDPTDDDFHKCQIDTETFDLTPLVELMAKTGNY